MMLVAIITHNEAFGASCRARQELAAKPKLSRKYTEQHANSTI